MAGLLGGVDMIHLEPLPGTALTTGAVSLEPGDSAGLGPVLLVCPHVLAPTNVAGYFLERILFYFL